MIKHRLFPSSVFVIIVLAVIFLSINLIGGSLSLNILLIQTVHGIYQNPGDLSKLNLEWKSLAANNCQANWTLSRIAKYLNQPDQEMNYWLAFLACSPDPVELLRTAGSQNAKLAEEVVKRYPQDDANWVWLAGLTRNTDPVRAMGYYREALKINPANGYPYCAIGLIYQSNKDYKSAFTEYASCCVNGDPGFNGCLGAGMMMEKLKDQRTAIYYYRLSKLPKSLNKADLLEHQLLEEQP